MREYDFSGKVVVVTGSARGIGRRIAERFYAEGACVALCSISPGSKEGLQQEIAGDSRERIMAQACDVSKIDQVDAFMSSIVDTFGAIDILVNNAGIYIKEPSLGVTEQTWNKMVDVNLKSQFFVSQWFAKHLIARKSEGVIINLASVNSSLAIQDCAVYGATKTATVSLTRSFAHDWGEYGIRVNAVAPGSIPTDLNAAIYAQPGKTEALEAMLPLGRRGATDDIANAVLFLASDDASYITGQTLYVDGGYTIV